MEIEEIAIQIKKDAAHIQANIACLRSATDTGTSPEPTLRRIEERLSEVRGYTQELIRRVPENLSPLLVEIRESVLEMMSSSLKQQSAGQVKSAAPREAWCTDAIQKLTPQELNLFRLCLRNGLITYAEVADRLNISLITARGIVNRLFQDSDKRRLFDKKRRGGFISVGLTEAVEKKVRRKYENRLDDNEKFSLKLTRAYRPKDFDPL